MTELPPAHDGCTCLCHQQEGVMHVMACCGVLPAPKPLDEEELHDTIQLITRGLKNTLDSYLAMLTPEDQSEIRDRLQEQFRFWKG